MNIKVGCGEWGFRALPIRDHFIIAKRFGFRTLEFGIGGGKLGRLPATITTAEAAAFRELAKEFAIATPACCLENDFTLPDVGRHEKELQETLKQIEQAQACGAKQIRLFAGFTPAATMDEAIWSRMLAAFTVVEARCVELGLEISIETHGRITTVAGAAHHEHTVSTEPAALRRLLTALPKRIGFNWDPGNLKAVNPADQECGLPLLRGRITYCHLKDWRRRHGGWEACAIGDDDLAYGPLLRKHEYQGIHYIEYEPTRDVEAGIKRSLDYLQRIGFTLDFA